MTSIRDAETRDADDVVRVLADAFMDDAVSRWLLPQRPQRESLPDGPSPIPMWRAPVAQS